MTSEEIINLLKATRSFQQAAREAGFSVCKLKRILSKDRKLDQARELSRYKYNKLLRKKHEST